MPFISRMWTWWLQPFQQRSGEPFRAEDLGPLVEGQVGGHQDGSPLVALAEGLKKQLGTGAGQGHEAQFFDDHQIRTGKLTLQVEQPATCPAVMGTS